MNGVAMNHVKSFLDNMAHLLTSMDQGPVDRLVRLLMRLRDDGGRVFVLGLGGSAGNASHATADLRRLAGIAAFCPTDNISEFSAAINDDGWDDCLAVMLSTARLGPADLLLIFSVGGGDTSRGVSVPLVSACRYAKAQRTTVVSVIGRMEGAVVPLSDEVICVSGGNPATLTMHAEAAQAVIWHLLVCDPRLRRRLGHWEAILETSSLP
jgi:D-sedoheptulose 7-phosphate isomerase